MLPFLTGATTEGAKDARLQGGLRKAPVNGWTYVRLVGTPSQIGYQHGYLLAPEIVEMVKIIDLENSHDLKKDWAFFREASKNMLWPKIETEYREELTAMAEGVNAKLGKKAVDVWDMVALNAALEWSYYVKQYDKQHKTASPKTATAGDHCSAFVATGSYTKNGKPVIAHNNWTDYLTGARWTMVYDVNPVKGHRFVMDGLPGLIHSADDFGINSAGIAITETTITAFEGWDPNGIAEFVRARKAMQYSESIDDFARIMKTGNNGGYANNWLIVDNKTNEIASLELGLKNVTLQRTKDGYFAGSNYPENPKLLKEETTYNPNDPGLSGTARHIRWGQLMAANKGKIDLELAHEFMADHFDTFENKETASERTLCGHVESSPRGMGDWQPPFGMAGAVQNKAADSAMIDQMKFTAAAGHACGTDFKAAEHLKAHPEFNWMKEFAIDMPGRAWTIVGH